MIDTWTIERLAQETERQGRPVSDQYIRRLCKQGKIKAAKPGRDWVISDEEAQRWLKEWLKSDDSTSIP